MKRFVTIALFALALAAVASPSAAQTDGPIGQVRQPLVGGTLVEIARQRELGLVSVSVGCSGTLLNRYWVLTADHCLTDNNGREVPVNQVTIRAAWTTRAGRPVRYVRFGGRGLDVALIQIGEEMDYTGLQLIYNQPYDPRAGNFLTKFGRGIHGFASGSGASATPAPSDGAYRMITVEASVSNNNVITIPSSGGAVGHGGDSGGADFVTAPNGAYLGIASVQSSCTGAFVPDHGDTWPWATNITSCNSAPLITLRAEILEIIRDRPPRWGDLEIAGAGASASSAEFDAVSRQRNTMEMWWIGPRGSIENAYWYEGGDWRRQQIAPQGSASITGAVSALSRRANTMEIWWIGAEGSIENAYWYEQGTWTRQQIASAGAAATQGVVASLSRQPNTIETWWIGPAGSIEGAFWYEGARWERYQIAPAGSASLSGGLTALSRASNTMELFWIGPNGSIEGAYWYEGGRWARHQIAPAGSAANVAKIAALARRSDTMEIWWTSPQGAIEGAFWYEGNPWRRHRIAPAGSAHPQTSIAAVSRRPDTLEIWWTRPDGAVRDAFWYEGGAWASFDLAASGRSSTSGGMTAVSRFPDTMEVWFVGADGAIRDLFFYD